LTHTPIRPSESTQSFVTPVASGRWDEGDSLGSIELPGGVSLGLEGVQEVEEGGSDGEMEYMPPKVIGGL
jgi:hypothetical protein